MSRRLHSLGTHNPSRCKQGPLVTTSGLCSFGKRIAGFCRFRSEAGRPNRGTNLLVTRPEKSHSGPRVSQPREPPPGRPAMQVPKNQPVTETRFLPVWRPLPAGRRLKTRVPTQTYHLQDLSRAGPSLWRLLAATCFWPLANFLLEPANSTQFLDC